MKSRQEQRHLLAAWNPTYRQDTVEAHIDRLLTAADSFRRGRLEEEDVYVWWGKFRSPNRHDPLPHLNEILQLDTECNPEVAPEREVHLYVTDYQSLYVGHIAEITADNMLEDEAEHSHIPEYYLTMRPEVDCWFRLFDIRRLVGADATSVIGELGKLRNTRHMSRPVSIYGGMVDLPLIVTRPDAERYFADSDRKLLADGKFWAEYQAEQVGVGLTERELREDLFGDYAWGRLDPATRTFVATGEAIYRARRYDASFDFTPVVVEFAKAFEVQCNSVMRRALIDAPPRVREVNLDGAVIDVAKRGGLNLGQLARVIGDNELVNKQLKLRLAHGEWFTTSLPAILRMIADLRNEAAHHKRVAREEATKLRNQLVGIGCQAELVELSRVGSLSERVERNASRRRRS